MLPQHCKVLEKVFIGSLLIQALTSFKPLICLIRESNNLLIAMLSLQ